MYLPLSINKIEVWPRFLKCVSPKKLCMIPCFDKDFWEFKVLVQY